MKVTSKERVNDQESYLLEYKEPASLFRKHNGLSLTN